MAEKLHWQLEQRETKQQEQARPQRPRSLPTLGLAHSEALFE